MASGVYNVGLQYLASGQVVWGTSTLKVMLLKPTYTFNRDDDAVSTLATHELSSANYARKTLAGFSSSVNQTLDRAYLDAADVSWGSPAIAAGQSIGFAVVFRDSGSDATSIPLLCFDLIDQDPAGITYKLQWNSLGLVRLKDATA